MDEEVEDLFIGLSQQHVHRVYRGCWEKHQKCSSPPTIHVCNRLIHFYIQVINVTTHSSQLSSDHAVAAANNAALPRLQSLTQRRHEPIALLLSEL